MRMKYRLPSIILLAFMFSITLMAAQARAEYRARMGYHNLFSSNNLDGEDELQNANHVFELTKSVGDWTLFGVSWWVVQADSNSSIPYDFSRYDQLLDIALDKELNVIMQVWQTPWFARLAAFQDCSTGCISGCQQCGYSALKNHPSVKAKWKEFCAAVARRYYPRVQHFEIGNEPNEKYYYRTVVLEADSLADSANEIVSYAEYLNIASSAMQFVGDSIQACADSLHSMPLKIIGGAMFPATATSYIGGDSSMVDKIRPDEFLQGLFDYMDTVDTLNYSNYFDILSYHPYGPFHVTDPAAMIQDPLYYEEDQSTLSGIAPSNSFMFTAELDMLLKQYCEADSSVAESKEVWATECGPPLAGCDAQSAMDEQRQGLWADRYLQQWHQWEFTGPILWWCVHEVRECWGAINYDWTKQPAYHVWHAWGNSSTERMDLHIGEGPDFLYHAWDDAFESRFQLEAANRDTVRVYIHASDSPIFVQSPTVIGVGPTCIEVIGVTGSPSEMEEALAGQVVLEAVGNLWHLPFLTVHDSATNLTLENLTLQGFGEGEDLNHRELMTFGHCVHFSGKALHIDNCRFLDNGVASFNSEVGLWDGFGPVLFVDGSTSCLHVENSLFVGNESGCQPGACVVALNADSLTLLSTTFHDNAINIYYPGRNEDAECGPAIDHAVSGHAIHVIQAQHTAIKGCLFTGEYPGGAWDSGRLPQFDIQAGSSQVSFSATDQDGWASDQQTFPVAMGNVLVPHAESDVRIGYVDADNRDFRLRQDSELLDRGDPNPEKKNFDLTRSDIGWTPNYQVIELGAYAQGPLPAGFYEVSGPVCAINHDIAAGAVIRVHEGSLLQILTSAGSNRRIGDHDGPRTAIVGRGSQVGEPAAGIELLNVSNESSLLLEGVLFNYAPRSCDVDGQSASLHIYDSGHADMLSVSFDHVVFENYVNVPDPSGQAYDGNLLLRDCEATLSGLDVGDANDDGYGIGQLQLVNSNVRVEGSTFIPTARSILSGEPSLKIHGVLAGGETELVDNTFHGLPGSMSGPILLDATGSTVRMEGNQFLDLRNTALIESNSSLYMDREARNHFRAHLFPDSFETNAPLLAMESGNLDLFCGCNNLLAVGINWPIISWQVANPETLQTVPQVWRDNFWGTDCALGLEPNEVESLDLVPDWVTLESTLDACVSPLDPANPLCPFTAYEPYELLVAGKDAEKDGDLALAHVNYTALLHLYPLAKEVNDGTLRLKAVGQDKAYGPLHVELVRDDLFVAADSTEANKRHSLSVLQLCSGWCTEARWGDRASAIAALEDLLTVETDPLCRDTIHRALLEIATYPPPEGALLAASPEARLNRAIQESRAVSALLSYQRGSELASEPSPILPVEFAITRIYPNPFNPTTTIELALPEEQRVRVRVYNMLGQQVAEVLNENLTAGTHKLIFDSSRYASGVYFARAEIQGLTKISKMLLLK